MNKLNQTFKLNKNKFQDNRILITHKLNKLKK